MEPAGCQIWSSAQRRTRRWHQNLEAVLRGALLRAGRPSCETYAVADRRAGRTQWPTVVRDARSSRPRCGTSSDRGGLLQGYDGPARSDDFRL